MSEANESFLFQPEYGDTLDVDGTRLFALVEPTSAGARVRGRIVVSPLTKMLISLWMLTVAVVTIRAFALGEEAPARVLEMGALLLGGAVLFARYRLSSMSRRVEARLRERLEASRASAAA